MPITHTYHDTKTGVDLIIEEVAQSHSDVASLTYKLNDTAIGFSYLAPLLLCKSVTASCYATIYEKFRGRGLGGACLRARMKIAKDGGAEIMFCTVNSSNAAELHLLQSHGFTQTFSWHSRYENGSAVLMFCKNLNEV